MSYKVPTRSLTMKPGGETLPKALTKSCCRRKQSFSPGKLVGVFINLYTAIS